MKRIFILLILILTFGIVNGQSNYEKYALPVIKKVNDTTYNPLKKSSVLVTPKVTAGQYYGGQDIPVFPSNTEQSEVHISLDVNNPSHLLISANTLLGPYLYQQGWYLSNDSGENWSGSNELPFADSLGGDPSTAFTSNGNLYISTLIFKAGDYYDGYYVYKSSDQGQHWTFHRGDSTNWYAFDKEMIACDNALSSPYKDNLYCAWTQFDLQIKVMFNRSTDGGISFSQPIVLENGFGQGVNVQTGPDGNVYVCWANYGTGNVPANGIGFTKSVDGGASFLPYTVAFPYSGIRKSGTDSTFNYIGMNDFPSMAVDKSNGPHRGRIYIAYPTKENGNGKAIIQVRYSDNEGSTWSSPYTVSISNGRQNFFPWIAVDNSTGVVCVVYYSFDSPSGWSTNTYMAYSKNGNVWYNMRVSDVGHITAPINNTYYRTGYAGDYIGVAAYGGKAYPAWMDNRNGTWQVYVSPVHFVFPSISGDSTVCTSGSTFTLNTPPPNTTVTWTQSSNLTYVSGQGTDNYTVAAANSSVIGMGWVQAIVNSGYGNDTLKKDVWVGVPSTPTIICPYKLVGLNSLIEANAVGPGADNYYWSIGGGTITSGQGTSDIWIMTNSHCQYDLTIRLTTSNACGSSAQAVKSIPFDCSGGITPLSVSPNPANNILTVEINNNKTPANINNIDFKTSELRVYDKMMNLKMKKTFRGRKTQINVRNLKQGVYILQIISGNKIFKKEIMVSHH